jgi:hypothetical protein
MAASGRSGLDALPIGAAVEVQRSEQPIMPLLADRSV